MNAIDINLPECLKQLNPRLVLYFGDDADTVKKNLATNENNDIYSNVVYYG